VCENLCSASSLEPRDTCEDELDDAVEYRRGEELSISSGESPFVCEPRPSHPPERLVPEAWLTHSTLPALAESVYFIEAGSYVRFIVMLCRRL
jgi:hypothetical protein